MHSLLNKYRGLSDRMKATFWFLVCSILQRGISTITTPIFTRLLSTDEYGKYGVFTSWLSIIQIVVTLELTAGVYTMGIVKFREEEKVFTSSLQGLNLVLCVSWTVIYLLFRDFWNSMFSLTTVQMLAMLVMIWSTAAFHFWMTTQRNQFRYKKLVIVTLVVSLLKPIVGIVLVINAEDKVTARILGLALVEFIGYAGFFFVQMKKGKKFYSPKFWKYAVLFNLPLLPHYLSGTILASSDRIMIEKIVGPSEAGIYTLAYSISLIMNLVKDSLNKTLSPYLYQRIREKDYDSIPKAVYPMLLVMAVSNLVLIAFAPEAIAVFAPKEYTDAIYVIPPVAMSVYVQFLYLCFAPFEFYFEKRAWTTIGTLTSALLNLLLNYIFIRIFGYQAAGYTTLICYSMNAMLHYYFMRKVCRTFLDDQKVYNLGMLLLITLGFFGVGFLYILTYSNMVLRYILTVVLCVLVVMNRKKLLSAIRPRKKQKKDPQ